MRVIGLLLGLSKVCKILLKLMNLYKSHIFWLCLAQVIWPLLIIIAKEIKHYKSLGKSTCHLDMGSVIGIVIEQSQIMLMIDWKFTICNQILESDFYT